MDRPSAEGRAGAAAGPGASPDRGGDPDRADPRPLVSAPLSRRRLLQQSAGLALAGCPRSGASARRVVVIGAGLAGLSCALELNRKGRGVQLLEASERVGGRVQTQRIGGLVVELGATRILAGHDRVHAYADLFGIERTPVDPDRAGIDLAVVQGQRVAPDGAIPGGLTPGEALAWQQGRLLELYLLPLMAQLGDPLRPGWPPPDLDALDRLSLAAYLASRGASEAAIALLTLGGLSGWVDRLGILQHARHVGLDDLSSPATWLVGGNDALTEALARALTGSLEVGAAVREIRVQRNGIARLSIERRGLLSTLEAGVVVAAVPLAALRRIRLVGLSSQVRRAIDETHYVEITQSNLSFSSRFWIERGLSGRLRTDRPLQEVWPQAGAPRADPRGILTNSTTGQAAIELGAMGEAERGTFLHEQLVMAFGGPVPEPTLLSTRAWHLDALIGGGWPVFGPGQGWIQRRLQQPDGPLWLAGDHASPWPGWMQGALYSGERVAQRILAEA